MKLLIAITLNRFFFVLFLAFVFCSRDKTENTVLAKIGDRKIYLNDYLNRAELTVRPAFLKGNKATEKKLVLNALIAEKILANEAEEDAEITQNEKLQNYVTGITEQKMREMHFNQFAIDQVKLDKNEVEELVQNANRRYNLSYFDISVAENYDSVANVFNEDQNEFDKILNKYYPGRSAQTQSVAWNNVFNTELFGNLFNDPVSPGDIIGPVIRDDNRAFFFRVDSWKNSVTLSETELQTIREKTEARIRGLLASEKYETVISDLMADKKLVFDMEGLLPLINILGPVFLSDDEQNNFLGSQMQRYQQEVVLDTLRRSKHLAGEKPVLQLDNKTWSIADIFDEMQRHPLVFRKRRMAKKEFGEQLKLALVDLMRDHYITKQAYDMGFDKSPEIVNTKSLWEDHFYSLLMRDKFIKEKSDTLMNNIEYIDQRIRKLRVKYKNDIMINEDLLNITEISEVQMLAFQKNVPYPMVSPGFPLLTLDTN